VKQKAEFITQENGKNTRLRFEQSQKDFALDRDEIIFLTQIPERYLLDEMTSRGYALSDNVVSLQKAEMFGDKLLDIIIDAFCIESQGSIDDLYPFLINRAVRRFGSQKEAAKALQMTARKVNYWVKGRYEVRPSKKTSTLSLPEYKEEEKVTTVVVEGIDESPQTKCSDEKKPSHEIEDDWDW
jgi:hypothetical protein